MADVAERMARVEGRLEVHEQERVDLRDAVRVLDEKVDRRLDALDQKLDRRVDELSLRVTTVDHKLDEGLGALRTEMSQMRIEAKGHFYWVLGFFGATVTAMVLMAIEIMRG